MDRCDNRISLANCRGCRDREKPVAQEEKEWVIRTQDVDRGEVNEEIHPAHKAAIDGSNEANAADARAGVSEKMAPHSTLSFEVLSVSGTPLKRISLGFRHSAATRRRENGNAR